MDIKHLTMINGGDTLIVVRGRICLTVCLKCAIYTDIQLLPVNHFGSS